MRVCIHFPLPCSPSILLFFFNDTATTEIYTLSLHDALPIFLSMSGLSPGMRLKRPVEAAELPTRAPRRTSRQLDRKSTRLNSSHSQISYAVFCLKKKNNVSHYADPRPIYEPFSDEIMPVTPN